MMKLLVFTAALVVAWLCLRTEWPADGDWYNVIWASVTAFYWSLFLCGLTPILLIDWDNT